MIRYQKFTVSFVQVNSYLVWDESLEACLIDPGFSTPSEQDQLINFIESNNLILVRCIATHMHFDHVLGARFVMDRFGIDVEVPSLEISTLPDLATQLRAFGMPFSEDFSFRPKPLNISEPGNCIVFGKSRLMILDTPGHSPGHYTYYDPTGEGLVFCGDVLFCDGMGRTDLWGGSYDTLMHSIISVLFKLPDTTKVLPGHGPETTIGREKRNFM